MTTTDESAGTEDSPSDGRTPADRADLSHTTGAETVGKPKKFVEFMKNFTIVVTGFTVGVSFAGRTSAFLGVERPRFAGHCDTVLLRPTYAGMSPDAPCCKNRPQAVLHNDLPALLQENGLTVAAATSIAEACGKAEMLGTPAWIPVLHSQRENSADWYFRMHEVPLEFCRAGGLVAHPVPDVGQGRGAFPISDTQVPDGPLRYWHHRCHQYCWEKQYCGPLRHMAFDMALSDGVPPDEDCRPVHTDSIEGTYRDWFETTFPPIRVKPTDKKGSSFDYRDTSDRVRSASVIAREIRAASGCWALFEGVEAIGND